MSRGDTKMIIIPINKGKYPSEYTLYNSLTMNVNIFLNLVIFRLFACIEKAVVIYFLYITLKFDKQAVAYKKIADLRKERNFNDFHRRNLEKRM